MPIPDFQTVMRPLLVRYADGVADAPKARRRGSADKFGGERLPAA